MLARFIFLAVKSCKEYFGLSMLSRYVCSVRESTSDCDDFSALFDGKSLSEMPLFGILKWPHARVDQVIIFDEDTPEQLIRQVRPDVITKGGDYTANDVVGRDQVKAVVILPLVKDTSTSNIIDRIKNAS